jgi:hypothetical protein
MFGLAEQAMLKHSLSKFLRAPRAPASGLAQAPGGALAAGGRASPDASLPPARIDPSCHQSL